MLLNFKTTDYEAWKQPCHSYAGVEEALEVILHKDGIHHVPCESSVLDVLVIGSERLKDTRGICPLLVAFTAAQTNRTGRKAPFFSGREVAKSLGLPLIAISDPTLCLNDDIPLAWYAGNEAIPKLPHHIAKILFGIANRYEVRLILFGGSGAGFAVLSQLHILKCNATGFVWNPQTSISEYVPEVVRTYVSTAFPKLRDKADQTSQMSQHAARVLLKQLLNMADIHHDLITEPNRQGSLLYIQNQGDWHHITKHAKPYLSRGKWSRLSARAFAEAGGRSACWFGNWSKKGHASPPKELIVRILSDLAAGKAITQIAGDLDTSLTENDIPFIWVGADDVREGSSVEVQVHDRQVDVLCVPNGTDALVSKEVVVTNRANCSIEKVTLDHEGGDLVATVVFDAPETGEFAFYVYRNRERIHTQWYSPNPILRFGIKAEPGLYRVLVFLRAPDGTTITKYSNPVVLHPVI